MRPQFFLPKSSDRNGVVYPRRATPFGGMGRSTKIREKNDLTVKERRRRSSSSSFGGF